MTPLTPQQKLCLDGIKDLTIDGVGPTYDELREYMGIASKSGVFRCVNALVERGHLRRFPGRARSLEVVDRSGAPYTVEGLSRLSACSLQLVIERCSALLQSRAS
jgi:repressor LexA